MLETPEIVRTEARPVAVIRLIVPRSEIQKVMGPGIEEVVKAVTAQGIGPAGPVFAHHFRMDPDMFDFEIGVPVLAPVSPTGRVGSGELPAATVARTVYRGPYEGLAAAWGELQTWIAEGRHTPRADFWECYVSGPESGPDPSTWRTELNRPLVE